MPSRKRNKGKERRAKKELMAGVWWRSWASGDCNGNKADCNHGCLALPPPEHAVSKLMNTFEETLKRQTHCIVATETAFRMHPKLLKDDEHRQMALSVFLSLGTNQILHKEYGNDEGRQRLVWEISLAISILDCYDGRGSDFVYAAQCAQANHPVLANNCGTRDVLKYYSKSLPCSCLKETYKQARKTCPKMGRCTSSHCRQEKDRSSMWVCGRCKSCFYCSRECQLAGWQDHKEDCYVFADIRKRREV